jgi:predicted GIY-YIG superfamily endonuclease
MSKQQDTCYLLHFTAPYRHAAHYLGSTSDLPARLEAHRNGTGARLMEVIGSAGISFSLVRTWKGGRKKERQLKRRGGHRRLCPVCRARTADASESSLCASDARV